MNDSFDKNLVGQLIASGGEHRVFRYGDDKVIKFPFGPRYWFNPTRYCENLRRDEAVVRKYFGEYLIKREIRFFKDRGKPSYVIIEPLLFSRHLQREDLIDSEVLRQFKELVVINDEMIDHEDLSAEFFGLRGLLVHGKREAANIMFNSKTKQLTLIDAGIMHFGRHKDRQILISLVTNWALKKQRKLINYYSEK